jgi:hypothetical protein
VLMQPDDAPLLTEKLKDIGNSLSYSKELLKIIY